LGHAGPVGAWGFAGAYHKGLVVSVHPPPRTNPVPKTATNQQPNQVLLLTGMAAPLALGHIFAAHAAQMVAFPAVLTNQHAALLSAAPLVRCLTHLTCHIDFL